VSTVPAVGYAGSSRLIRFWFRLAKATRGCAVACDEFEPDVVLGMGGFTSVPALVAARWFCRRGSGDRQLPATLIHESNAVPGKANRWAGRFADGVAVGLPECARFFRRQPVTVTGTPIRAALRAWSRPGRRAEARERLGLSPERLTVLVAGGSQGAHAINEAVTAALPWLDGRCGTLQFVHLTGPQDEQFVRESYERNGWEANVMSFCDQMEVVYGAADMIVARSGAATLAEIAAFGLPSILVPYPHAAGNHQWHNARVFERAGAARLVEPARWSEPRAERGQHLAAAIGGLLDDEVGRRRMARAARALAVDDAAERLATLLEDCGQ
jgi:UDP-N-acetylglucosamine--N-acetylmuramyl-(pentapeptide) pyrophosphoryl-undecaprenol N-acetylglucosamine transferase